MRVDDPRRGFALSQCGGYTFGMKTAISIPDDVFEQAEELARKLKKSRSELYREAIAEYLARHDADSITASLDRVADEVGGTETKFRRAAARRAFERSEW